MLVGPGIPLLHKCAQGSRRGVENIYFMLRHDFPETTEVRIVRHPFEYGAGRAIGKRPVHNVTVPRHPADVSRTPIDITRSIIKDVLVCASNLDEVSTSSMQDSFRFPGRARGIQ